MQTPIRDPPEVSTYGSMETPKRNARALTPRLWGAAWQFIPIWGCFLRVFALLAPKSTPFPLLFLGGLSGAGICGLGGGRRVTALPAPVGFEFSRSQRSVLPFLAPGLPRSEPGEAGPPLGSGGSGGGRFVRADALAAARPRGPAAAPPAGPPLFVPEFGAFPGWEKAPGRVLGVSGRVLGPQQPFRPTNRGAVGRGGTAWRGGWRNARVSGGEMWKGSSEPPQAEGSFLGRRFERGN